MAGSMSRQNEAKPVFRLATKAHLACLGFPVLVLQEKIFLSGHIINLLSTKLIFHGQDGWILAFSYVVDICLDCVFKKKNLTIWTSSLVNRAFVSLNLNFYVGVDRTVLDARIK